MSRINTNIPSMVAQRVLSANNTSLTTSLNRLSTGLKINSGKDDPAGLIASETLRAEIQFCIDSKVGGIISPVMVSEFWHLSEEERRTMIRIPASLFARRHGAILVYARVG